MLRTIYFDNQLCRSAVKIHNESADDPLFVNLYRVFAEKKIPELALMGCHFPAKPPGVFQLAIVFWYGHILPSQSASPPALPKGEPGTASNALHRTMYRSARFYPASGHTQTYVLSINGFSIPPPRIHSAPPFTQGRLFSAQHFLRPPCVKGAVSFCCVICYSVSSH